MDNSIELKNEVMYALISLNGAELIRFGNHSGPPILWSKQTDHWNRIAPNLFPIVGKLLDDVYTFRGKTYRMTQHGFARDRKFEVVEQNETEVRLRLVSDAESMDVYPFLFRFDVCYSLTESGVRISYETQNTGEERLFYSVGGHPAFQLEEPLENYYLEFDSDVQLERETLSGSYFSGETIYYGVSNQLGLSDELFENDAFVLKSPAFHSVCLKHKNGKTLVQMTCDSWTAIGFWTKKGAPFICIEPWWGWADRTDSTGKLEEKPGIRILDPGKKETLSYELKMKNINIDKAF